MIKFNLSNFTIDAAAPGEPARRTITGTALPYDIFATVADGTRVSFAAGSLPTTGKMPKLFMYHDSTQPVGLVTERVDTAEGMMFTAKISNTRAGDEALVLAADGVLDSVSVGVNPTDYKFDDNGDMIVFAADWVELSLVPTPAFAGATISQVAASAPDEEAEEVEEVTEPETEKETPMEIQAAAEVVIPTSPIFASVKKEPRIPNAWEYMAAMHKGGDAWINAQKVFQDYRDFHRDPLVTAAAGDEFLTSVPGLLTQVTMGPVFEDINYMRPVVSALGARAMPSSPSSTFNRPTWTTHQATATSQTEGAAVATQTGVIANNTVTKKTFANSANISYQTLDFTDPAALQITINDLIGGYMVGTDNEAADNLLTAATSAGVWDLTVADLYKSIYDAAVVTLTATNMLPTHMFVDPATYALIMQLADTTGRTLFANLNGGLSGMNSMGVGNATSLSSSDNRNDQGPLGLKLVVDNNFAAKTMVIMKDIGFEIYEDWKGIMSLDQPTTLTRAVSTHGYFCTFKANGSMIQKITQA
jgi:HK97 family phage prohead protease